MKVSSVILSIFLLISAMLSIPVSSVSARDWKEGDNGDVRWDNYCRYVGDYISYKHSTDRQCGRVCLFNYRCTHFTHGDGVCYMYASIFGRSVDYGWAPGWVCGYVPDRILDTSVVYGRRKPQLLAV
uniref:Apple domain-containing protein n=1 Tax=Daphnia galeata TaxID=27404 RepID=A0A8J2RR73_9CRUS|nr:unnamed protein product [Daphnia galeata]